MAIRSLMLSCPQWTTIYRCIKHEDVQDVIVLSESKPKRKRSFRIPGKGKAKFEAVSRTRLQPPKEGKAMAKRKTKKKAEDQVEEEDNLEDLEDLDELEDVEEDEPDEDVEDDDSDDEDEDLDDDEEEDEDDDEDEEDEEEDLTDLPIGKLRDRAIAAGLSASKAKKQKGNKGKAALAKYIEKHEEADADEDDDEPEEKPAKKSKSKKGKKGKGKGGTPPPTRELPKGRHGAQEIADIAGTDARSVRVFLRKHADEFPKDEELGRYSFTKKEAEKIAKKIKKASKSDD